MRHPLLLTVALLLTLASACKKEDDEAFNPYVPPYRVSGVVDFAIQKYAIGADPYEMYVQVEYENGEQERVSLALEGVPAGLEDSMVNSSGYPTFMSRIILVDSGVAEGNYTLRLVVTGERSGRREFPFNVRILGVPDCSSRLLGSYTASSTCSTSATYTMTIQALPAIKNRVLLSNLNNNGTELYADVDCTGGTGSNTYITIPAQIVNGVSYNGYGYYSTNPSQPAVSLNVYRSGFGSCNYQLLR